jgi:hypothetical protein
VWTTKGLVEYFVLFFIQVGSRRLHIAGMTPNPNARWVGQQARKSLCRLAETRKRRAFSRPALCVNRCVPAVRRKEEKLPVSSHDCTQDHYNTS